MEILADGLGMLEGPVNCRDGSLVVTSLDLGKVFRITAEGCHLLADTGGGANGATEGPDGAIYIAQNGGTGPALNHRTAPAGVQVIAADGSLSAFGGEMRSPNDLCFGPDGFLYVTDPTRKPERDDGRVWRCNIATGHCTLLFTCDWYPNGIGFSAEDDFIYIADSRHRRIVRLPIEAPTLDRMETHFMLDHGTPDGFAFDTTGHLVTAAPDFGPAGGDVQVYRNGRYVEAIDPGHAQLYTNLSISSDGRLYLCDADNGLVLTRPWPSNGLALHPFRDAAQVSGVAVTQTHRPGDAT